MNRASNVAIATVLLLAAFSSADEGKEKLPDLPVAASSLGPSSATGSCTSTAVTWPRR